MDFAGTPPLVAALAVVLLLGVFAAGQPQTPGRERDGVSAGLVTLGVIAAALVAIYLVAR